MKYNIGFKKISMTLPKLSNETALLHIFLCNLKPFLNYHESQVWNKKISQKDKSKFSVADTSASPTLLNFDQEDEINSNGVKPQ